MTFPLLEAVLDLVEDVSKSDAASVYHRDYVRTRKKAYRIRNSNRNPKKRANSALPVAKE